MIYVGMDVGSKKFMIHAINDRKKVLYKGEIDASRRGLRSLARELGDQSKLFAFEAGHQLKWVAETLKQLKVGMHVVHPNEVKWITKSKQKTDKIDAKKLSELARSEMLPEKVHVVEGNVRSLRELIRTRDMIQSKRISMLNSIRGFALQDGVKLPAQFFAQGKWKIEASTLKLSATVEKIVTELMSCIDQLFESEKTLLDEIKSIDDKRIELLKSIPTIGDLSSRVILSAIDDAKRFKNKKKVANYGSLSPRIYQSGGTLHLGRINPDGRREVRKVLLQCAHTVTRMRTPSSQPLKQFYERIEKNRGKKKAVIALARKLLTTAYGVLKTGEYYNPQKLMPHAA